MRPGARRILHSPVASGPVYKSGMSILKCLAGLSVILLAGCAQVNESSATASQEQIRAHLMAQLHCQRLDLRDEGKGRFTGAGKNDTGDFDITVTRKAGKIVFEGAYTAPAQGTFSGSSSWQKQVNAAFGWHKSGATSETTFSSR